MFQFHQIHTQIRICINFIKCILRSEYVSISSNAYSDLYDINSKLFDCSQDQIDDFVTNLKKDGYCFKKRWLFLIFLSS